MIAKGDGLSGGKMEIKMDKTNWGAKSKKSE